MQLPKTVPALSVLRLQAEPAPEENALLPLNNSRGWWEH